MSKQPAPTASAIGPCPTIIQIVGRPGTGSLPSTFALPEFLKAYAVGVIIVWIIFADPLGSLSPFSDILKLGSAF